MKLQRVFDVLAVSSSRLARQVVLFAIMVVAARVLGKEKMGEWAIIYLIVQFGVLIADSGISVFILRHQNLTRSMYSTSFTLSTIFSCAFAVVLALLSYPISRLLQCEDRVYEFVVSSFLVVLTAWGGFFQARLRRDHRFQALFIIDLLCSLLLLLGSIMMIQLGYGLWALIIPLIISAAATAFLSMRITDRPQFVLDREQVKEIWDYVRGLLGFSTINFWSRNADTLLVASFLNAAALGVYNVAYRIMMTPISQINNIASSLTLSYLARYHEDPKRVRKGMEKVLISIGLVSTIPMVVLWLRRHEIVEIVFGSDWNRVGDLLFVLAPLGLLQSLVSPTGLCYQISGKTMLMFNVGLIQTITTLLSFIIGVSLGTIDAVVISYAICNLLLLIPTVEIAMRTVGGNFYDWGRVSIPFLLCVPICYFVDRWVVSPTNSYLAIATTLIWVTFLTTIMFLLFVLPKCRDWMIVWGTALKRST